MLGCVWPRRARAKWGVRPQACCCCRCCCLTASTSPLVERERTPMHGVSARPWWGDDGGKLVCFAHAQAVVAARRSSLPLRLPSSSPCPTTSAVLWPSPARRNTRLGALRIAVLRGLGRGPPVWRLTERKSSVAPPAPPRRPTPLLSPPALQRRLCPRRTASFVLSALGSPKHQQKRRRCRAPTLSLTLLLSPARVSLPSRVCAWRSSRF